MTKLEAFRKLAAARTTTIRKFDQAAFELVREQMRQVSNARTPESRRKAGVKAWQTRIKNLAARIAK